MSVVLQPQGVGNVKDMLAEVDCAGMTRGGGRGSKRLGEACITLLTMGRDDSPLAQKS